MSGARWEIWLDTPNGTRLALLNNALSWSVARVTNRIGAFSIILPGEFNERIAGVDFLVEFWRAPTLGNLRLESVGFVRKIGLTDDNRGRETVILSGPDSNDLLRRRIVAYYAGTAQTSMTNQADDMMKAIVTDQLGADAATDYTGATITGRDLSGLNFTIAGNLTAAPSITKGFSWRKLLDVLTEIAEASQQNGTNLYFEVVPRVVSDSVIGFEFRTRTGQPGIDHSYSTGANPVMFAKKWGNLESPLYEKDYSTEINYAYAAGQGNLSARSIVTRSNTARVNASIWNRCEGFTEDTREGVTTATLNSKADALIAGNRPRNRFAGTLVDSSQARYGIDWSYGDKVTAEYRGYQVDGVITAVTLSVDENGKETIAARLEV